MNPDSLVKILTFFNKPFHYLIAGIVILVFAEKDWAVWGWLLIGLTIASFLEWLINVGKEKYHKELNKKNEEEQKRIEKENLYKAYDKLNWKEKFVILRCVKDKNIVYQDKWSDDYEEMLSLSVKGFGQLKGDNTFVLNPQYLESCSKVR